MIHLPESVHLWTLFFAGHSLHVLKRASLSAQSNLSATKSVSEWMRLNALALVIRLFVNSAAFSYWIAHPSAATHAIATAGFPMDLTLEPGHATAALFGLSGDSMMDWAAAKVPFLQKEIPAIAPPLKERSARESLRGKAQGPAPRAHEMRYSGSHPTED